MDVIERRQRASAEAADWWLRLQLEDAPRNTREQYVDWLRESPVHVAEMLRIAQVHGALEQFNRWANIATDSDGDESQNVIALRTKPPEPPPPFNAFPSRLWAIAASVGVIAIAIGIFISSRGQIITTDRGERREVALNDGSTVQVDPETRLRIQFTATARDIILERGRALFKVAKNPSRPFEVHANDTRIRALGTAFGVERQTQGVLVTVAEGKVAVFPTESTNRNDPNTSLAILPPSPLDGEGRATSPASSLPSPSTGEGGPTGRMRNSSGNSSRNPNHQQLLLAANQQVTVGASGSDEVVHNVDSARELAWAQGRLVFENTTVSAVVAQFNRYNHLQIRVSDPTLAARPVSGVFDAFDPESFIAFMQSVAPIQVERTEAQGITLLAKR